MWSVRPRVGGFLATSRNRLLLRESKPVAQLSLTNPRDALHHDKRQGVGHFERKFQGEGSRPPTTLGVRRLESLGYHMALFA